MRRIVVLLLALCSVASAQPSESTLSPSGEWVKVAKPAANADAEVMDHCRALLAEGKPGQARSILNRWIDRHELDESPYLAEAYFLRADARTAGGNEYKALWDYEIVINEFAATEDYIKAVEREMQIGIHYVNGLRRRWLGMRLINAEDVGEELLVRTAERMPYSRLGERAILELADYYYRTRDLKYAALAYEKFVQLYPKSQHVGHARQHRIFASIGMFKGPNYDAAGLADARVLIEEYAKDDPIGARRANLSDALVAKLDESIAAQMLEKARFYLRRDDPVSARSTLRRLIKDHDQSVAASEARRMMKDRHWTIPVVAAPAEAMPPAAAPDSPKEPAP